ncbi:N-acetylmuramoyl-L-alanine amidase [Sphingomonas immobilis]|uniref:N-acetylmuramoyl-L-alanine amidase n=1 Tax=Sphingomonas immobilis TaxID=3063997 RepID=A0ABT9A537_9SPHN|nr:N-acetylmuramoyl-L-alanine amidase [Sphingomonas sp. CA1-15]MDO7844653.1 N-acetylmuramoyl-L-alanine amidase [Sphingomonas sp. CA1-15]
MPFHWTGRLPARQYSRVSFVLALLACWFAGSPGWAASVERVDVRPDRIVIRFDDHVGKASSFLLAGPQRIAVDVDGASIGRKLSASGLVTAIRQGPRGDTGVRIVFDLARPAVVSSGRFGNDGRDLTIALKTVDDATFARAANEGRLRFLPPFAFGTDVAAPRPKYHLAMAVPASSRTLQLPRIDGDDDSRPLVVIDAGHGGQDPGAISPDDGRREKDVTLRIAKAIRAELLASGRVRVALTREDDRFIVLQERYGIARKLHADLFISVHCDSVGSGDATGASVYTLSEVASDKESARLAARENRADIIAGVNLASTSADISSILIDLTQRETMNSSASFARLLGREAQPLIPVKPNFHRMASLMVLKAPDMPSILFETGYISNPRDAAFIDSPDGRKKIAESVRKAIDVHFARRLASN